MQVREAGQRLDTLGDRGGAPADTTRTSVLHHPPLSPDFQRCFNSLSQLLGGRCWCCQQQNNKSLDEKASAIPLSFKEPCITAHAEIEAALGSCEFITSRCLHGPSDTQRTQKQVEVMHTTLPLTENDQTFLLKIVHCSVLT